MAATVEALIGAVYVDSGESTSRESYYEGTGIDCLSWEAGNQRLSLAQGKGVHGWESVTGWGCRGFGMLGK